MRDSREVPGTQNRTVATVWRYALIGGLCLVAGYFVADLLSPRSLQEMQQIAENELMSFLAGEHRIELRSLLIGPSVDLPAVRTKLPRLVFVWHGPTEYGDTAEFAVAVPTDPNIVQLFTSPDDFGVGLSMTRNSRYLLNWGAPLSRIFKRPIEQERVSISVLSSFEHEGMAYFRLQPDSIICRKVYNGDVLFGMPEGSSVDIEFWEPIGVIVSGHEGAVVIDTTSLAKLTQIDSTNFILKPISGD